MTAKQALRKLGGEAKVSAFATEVTNRHGVTVEIEPQINDENPRDNWLDVLIETPNKLFDCNDRYSALDAATAEVVEFLAKHGLNMEYECGGDGASGPIHSYRVY